MAFFSNSYDSEANLGLFFDKTTRASKPVLTQLLCRAFIGSNEPVVHPFIGSAAQ